MDDSRRFVPRVVQSDPSRTVPDESIQETSNWPATWFTYLRGLVGWSVTFLSLDQKVLDMVDHVYLLGLSRNSDNILYPCSNPLFTLLWSAS